MTATLCRPISLRSTPTALERYLAGEEVGIDLLRDCCAVDPVQPWRILAITFTNKAAGELKSRLEATLGDEAQDIQAATFHSACVRNPPPGDHPGGL